MKNPDESDDDHGEADERGVAEKGRDGDVPERIEHDRQLQPDRDEEERVQQVQHDLPHRGALEPDLRGRQLGCGWASSREADQLSFVRRRPASEV